MARKKVIDLNADSMLEWSKPGQTAEGYYIGYKTVNSAHGESKLHVIQTDAGTVGCWGSAQLDSKLATVAKGTMVWITFGGKSKIQGGKTMKNFNVEYDDEDTIEVAGAIVQYSREASEEESEDLSNELPDNDPEEPNSEEDGDTEVNPAAETFQKRGAPAAATPAMKSKAAAMLAQIKAKGTKSV